MSQAVVDPLLTSNYLDLEREQRNALVISSVPMANGTICVLSRYGDTVWDLLPYMPHANRGDSEKKLRFDILPASWRESIKALLYAYWIHGRDGWRRPTCSTLIGTLKNFKPVAEYLISLGVTRFADVRPIHLAAYRQSRENSENKVQRVHIYRAIELAWVLKPYLKDHLPRHPWPDSSAWHMAGLSRRGPRRSKTQNIPMDIAAALFQAAEEMFERAPVLLGVRRALDDLVRQRHTQKERKLLVKQCLAKVGIATPRALKSQFAQLRTAGYFILGFLTGMRNHELASLQAGCYYETEQDGITYGWVKGVSIKTGEGATEWMIPPFAQRFITLLEEISHPVREQVESELAMLSKKLEKSSPDSLQFKSLVVRRQKLLQHRNGLFLAPSVDGKGMVLTRLQRWNELLAQFASDHHIDWKPATHELRRTFAVFVAEQGRGNLLYLKKHFKHWSLDMSALYALNEHQDPELYGEILNSMNELQTDTVANWLEPEAKLAGKGGDRVIRQRVHMKNMNMKNRREMAMRAGKGITIRSTGHSWCMADQFSCGGKGLYDSMRCIDCSHGLIDEAHRPIWQGIWHQQLELRNLTDIGPAAKARVEESIIAVQTILGKLGVEVDMPVQGEPDAQT